MNRYFAACVVACAAIVILFAAPSAAQSVNHPPAEVFGSLPAMSDVTISPDGTHLAAIQPYQGRPAAVIYDLTNPMIAPVLIPAARGFIVGVDWANNQRLFVTVNMNENWMSYQVNAWYRTISYDVKGQNPAVLMNNLPEFDNNLSTSGILDKPLEDPDHIYMVAAANYGGGDYSAGHGFYLAIYKVDVNTGKASKVMMGINTTVGFMMDGHGNVVARVDADKSPEVEHLLAYENGSWREVAKFDYSGDTDAAVMGLSSDGKSFLRLVTSGPNQTQAIAALSMADGKETILFSDPKYDMAAPLSDPWTNKILGYMYYADTLKLHFIDPEMVALQAGILRAFPGMSAFASNWTRDKQKLVVVTHAPRNPAQYFLLDLTTHQASLIGSAYPKLTPTDLGEVKPYPYKARDGLEIPAYLTLPPGKEAKNLPVVIFPHGGPTARDTMSFDFEAQFLANRGYAVLQPNFRGSSGYGLKFQEAGYGQWGLKMQDDITDGVKKLIADGIADPKRICIYGASYGGYVAEAGATFTPDLYACAASWAGVSDMALMYRETKDEHGKKSAYVTHWELFYGTRDSDELRKVSPSEHADAVKIPILLMHGVKDSTVRIKHSETMKSALESAGKKVTFIKIPGETHHMQAESTRITVLTELEKFLKENIGN